MTHKLLLLIINVVRARRGYHTRQCCYENQSPHPGLSVPLRYLLPAMRSVPAPVSLYRAHPRTHSTDIAQRGGLIQPPHPNPLPEGEGAPGPAPQPSPGEGEGAPGDRAGSRNPIGNSSCVALPPKWPRPASRPLRGLTSSRSASRRIKGGHETAMALYANTIAAISGFQH